MTIRLSRPPHVSLPRRLRQQVAVMAGKRRLVLAPRPPGRWLPWAIAIAAVSALVVGWFLTSTASTAQDDKTVAETQRDATAQQAGTLADQVAQACAAGGPTADDLNRIGACRQAQQVKTNPTPEPGPRGPGPTSAEIQSAVASYLAAHPPPAGRAPTAAEVSTAVAQYLTANPPTPGRAPTAAEIAAAVATYFAANPPRDGQDGQPGRAPTEAEIQAAVDNYLAAQPPAAGPAGPACPDGSSVQTVTYADGVVGKGCVLDEQPAPPENPNMGGLLGG
jgi:hypothetical protein